MGPCVDTRGIEPRTSALSERRSDLLSYVSRGRWCSSIPDVRPNLPCSPAPMREPDHFQRNGSSDGSPPPWLAREGSNLQLPHPECGVLPIELLAIGWETGVRTLNTGTKTPRVASYTISQWTRRESNPRHRALQARALPTELQVRGAVDRDRTGDLDVGNVALYQLSYNRRTPTGIQTQLPSSRARPCGTRRPSERWNGAGDGPRTRSLLVGSQMLVRLSFTRESLGGGLPLRS